ncbi:MAG: hypothetical protein SGJ04_00580 [Bacteroidota bacterium]|nr:hypothetical protein [Bacteroidota bacterium]
MLRALFKLLGFGLSPITFILGKLIATGALFAGIVSLLCYAIPSYPSDIVAVFAVLGMIMSLVAKFISRRAGNMAIIVNAIAIYFAFFGGKMDKVEVAYLHAKDAVYCLVTLSQLV